MESKSREQLGFILLAFCGAVMANVIINEMPWYVRAVSAILCLFGFWSGVWLVAATNNAIPLGLRSKEWTEQKLADLRDENNERDRRLLTGIPPRPERTFQEQTERDRFLRALEKRLHDGSLLDHARSRLKWKR